MKHVVFMLACVSLALAGCGSKKPEAVNPPAAEAPKSDIASPAAESAAPADPGTVASSAPQGPVADPQWVGQMQQAIAQLESLSRTGRSESDQYKDPGDVTEKSIESAQLTASWDAWVRGWDSRLDAALSSMPSQPTNAPEQCLFAYSEVQQASNELRHVSSSASDNSVPMKYQRKGHFDMADTHLQQARTYLSQIK